MYQVPIDATAVMGRRVGAWIIDFVAATVLFIVAANIFVDGYSDIPGNLCDDDQPMCSTSFAGDDGWALYDENTDTSVFLVGNGLFAPLAVFVGYGVLAFVLLEGAVGGSPGKLLTGLRVVRDDGRLAGIGKSLVRFLLWIVDAFPYCFPLVAVIAGFASKGHRRVGDMVAKTFVVAKESAGRPVSVPGLTPPAMMPPAVPTQAWSGAPDQGWAAPAPGPGPAPTGGDPSAWPQSSGPDPVASTQAASSGYEPQWDPARNTYIQWDPDRQTWLEWDTAHDEWRPI